MLEHMKMSRAVVGSKASMDNETKGHCGNVNTGGIAIVFLYMYFDYRRRVGMIPQMVDLVCLDLNALD